MLLSEGFTRTRRKLCLLYKCVRVTETSYCLFFFGSGSVRCVCCVVSTLGTLISSVCWFIFLFSVFCLVFSFFGFFVSVFCFVFVFWVFWLFFAVFCSPRFPVERGRCSSVILSNDFLWKVFNASGSPRSRRWLVFSRFKIFRKTFYSLYRIGWLTLFEC